MANENQVVVFRGKAMYAKVLGDPVLNYNKDGKEWKVDLALTPETVKEAKALGIGDRIKRAQPKEDEPDKPLYLDGHPYMSFKQAEYTKAGKKNDPIPVKDILGNPWPQDRLIGNGSDIDLRFAVVTTPGKAKKSAYIRSIRVLNHVPYDKVEFADLPVDDPFYEKMKEAQAQAEARHVEEDKQFREDFGVEQEFNDDLPV